MLGKSAGTLKVSNRIWAAVSRFVRGFKGGSVKSTGCYKQGQYRRRTLEAQDPAKLKVRKNVTISLTSSLIVFNSSS